MADIRTTDVRKAFEALPPTALQVGEELVRLRPARRGDVAEWARLRSVGRGHLERWEPQLEEPWEKVYAPRRLKGALRAQRQGAKSGRMLVLAVDVNGRFAGEVSIGGIVRGANQSGWLGYWIGEEYAGRGIGTAAVAMVLDVAFGALGIERVEATVKPDNAASIAVLERLGFLEEGRLRNHLRIGGARRDHLLYAALLTERMLPAAKDLELSGRVRRVEG
ncbi:GNAT family N-acetyltransferase [Dietzia sp.]|uniref:GNAT family N-acetyltransferase n=1 Tax=Dietzia sp. TaxID=1871616 RepID=UPI002FDA0204